MKKRIEFIDYAKGVCIMFIVLFHEQVSRLPYAAKWGGYVTTVYVVMFFLMSGLFFKPVELKAKLKRLLIPFLSFYVISFGVYAAKAFLKHDVIEWYKFILPFIGKTTGFEGSALWFLISLMEIITMAYLIAKYLRFQSGLPLSIAMSVFGYYLGTCFKVPYFIDVSMLCLPFFMVGYYYKENILQMKMKYGLGLFLLSIIFFMLNPGWTNVSMNNEPSGYIIFTLVALTGSIGIIVLCKLVKIKVLQKLLTFYGQNTLIIMCTHMMLLNIPFFIDRHIWNHWSSVICGFICIMLIEIPVIFLINKHAKFLIGK